MGRREDDEVAPSMLPTFVSGAPGTEATRPERTRLRAPDDDAHERTTYPDLGTMPSEDGYAVTYLQQQGIKVDSTYSLAPDDRALGAVPRGGGTLSVTPHDAIAHGPVSDTLVSLTNMAPNAARSRRAIQGVLGLALVAVIIALSALLMRPPALPALAAAPAPVLVQAPLGLAQSELSFLARRIDVPPMAATSVAPEPPHASEPPPRASESPRGRGPRARTREAPVATPAPTPVPVPVATTPPAPVAFGPDANVNVSVRVGGKAAVTELVVDGRIAGQTPLRLQLRPGRHTFEARGPSGSARKVVDIAPGSTEKVVLDIGAP